MTDGTITGEEQHTSLISTSSQAKKVSTSPLDLPHHCRPSGLINSVVTRMRSRGPSRRSVAQRSPDQTLPQHYKTTSKKYDNPIRPEKARGSLFTIKRLMKRCYKSEDQPICGDLSNADVVGFAQKRSTSINMVPPAIIGLFMVVTIVYWLILALNDESTRRERLFPLQVCMMDGKVANVVSPSSKSLDFNIFIASVDPSSNKFRPPAPIDVTAFDEYGLVDYGNLDIYMMVENVTRVIYHNYWEEAGEVRDLSVRDDDMDAYYSFDDDELRNPYKRYEDEGIKNGDNHCRRVAWHKYQFPNCNTFHEMNSAVNVPRYLSYGAYRDVFGHWNLYPGDRHDAVIWKQSSFKPDIDFTYDMYEFTRMDALVSERLSSSKLIVDIYGHCGLSILSELMSNGDLEDATIKGEGYSSAKDLDDADDVKPQNDFTAEDKLLIALEMAKSLAVLHDFPDGRIVHDDVQLSQFLYNSNGTIKLNDFNRAEIMLWDDEKQEYCRYRNNPGNGNYRAPEEYWDWPLNEKIDVYSFGNNIYALLTGLYPFYDLDYSHEDKLQKKIKKGKKPFIDPRYRTRSYAEGKLVDVMELCWAYHAEERPEIQTVIVQLQEASDHLDEHKEEQSSKEEQENG